MTEEHVREHAQEVHAEATRQARESFEGAIAYAEIEWTRCDPGCPGWFLSGETGKVERCDECDRFECDEHAGEHVAYGLWRGDVPRETVLEALSWARTYIDDPGAAKTKLETLDLIDDAMK
jgi:hypothetical protein